MYGARSSLWTPRRFDTARRILPAHARLASCTYNGVTTASKVDIGTQKNLRQVGWPVLASVPGAVEPPARVTSHSFPFLTATIHSTVTFDAVGEDVLQLTASGGPSRSPRRWSSESCQTMTRQVVEAGPNQTLTGTTGSAILTWTTVVLGTATDDGFSEPLSGAFFSHPMSRSRRVVSPYRVKYAGPS